MGSSTATSSGKDSIPSAVNAALVGNSVVTKICCPELVEAVACLPLMAGVAGRLSQKRLKRSFVAEVARS